MTSIKYFPLYICSLLFSSGVLFAQEQATVNQRAEEQFHLYNYAQVVQLLEPRVKLDQASAHDLYLIAESYLQMRDFKQAVAWYAKVVSKDDHTAAHAFQYAKALKAQGNYEESKQWFQESINKGGNSSAAYIQIAGCDSALATRPQTPAYTIENLGGLNSENAEITLNRINNHYYLVTEPSVNQESIGTTYGWTGNPYLKVYTFDEHPSNHVSISGATSPLFSTSEYHVGPVASPDQGKTLYVTRTFVGKGLAQKERNRKTRTQRLEIYIYKMDQNQQWSDAIPFAYNDPNQYSVGHAAFSTDGKIMYFVSDRPGGTGGADIWYCELETDGTWGTPKNAGPSINTVGNELFPTIGLQNEFYFSSDGHIGFGGLDIYQATGEKSNWTDLKHFKTPINTSYDDFAFHVVNDDEERLEGYFASNRPGGKGSDDIYRMQHEKPKPAPEPIVLLVQGKVLHQTTKEPISNAAIEVQVIPSQPTLKLFTNSRGAFEFSADTALNYQIRASKTTFVSNINSVTTVNITKSDTLYTELLLEPEYTVGKTFVLENLYYDYDKHHIRPDAALVLDGLAQILTENPTMKIELSSHTDSRGNDAYNLNLSQRRANAAVQYLIQKGIAKDRLVAKGYGETQLVNDCANGVKCTEEQHQANRRTEVKVLAM